MNCPECDGKTKVVDGGSYIGIYIRRRRCMSCNKLFYTIEEETDDISTIRSWLSHVKAEHRNKKKEVKSHE